MKGTKYLSELVNMDSFEIKALNLIYAPTGSGKTYFALNEIPKRCDDVQHEAIFLIDTINGKEQILHHSKAIPVDWRWIKDVEKEGLWFDPKEKMVVMTYAKFGYILEQRPDFYGHFKYIVCDELHNDICFQGYNRGSGPNYHLIAQRGLENAVRNDKTTVIAMTATPNKVKERFNTDIKQIYVDMEQVIHYEEETIEKYRNLDYLISEMDASQIGICYTEHIQKMKKIQEIADGIGLKPIAVWSIGNTDHPMTEEQLNVRKTILEEERIPEQYNFLIINSSLGTSVKIKSTVDYVIIDDGDEDVQIQVRGRVNSDLKTLYLRTADATEIVIPEKFLGVPLTTKEKEELCEYLNLRNENGRRKGWSSVKNYLVEQNYAIQEKRVNNLRVVVITNPREE